MLKRLLVFLLVVCWGATATAQEKPWSEYPPDDPKLKLIDREALTIYEGDAEIHFYATLSSDEERSYLDVYRGAPWRRVHRWALEFEDQPVRVRERAVLQVVHDQEKREIYFFWRGYVGYIDGDVHLVLTYHRDSDKFTTSWSD